jgi:hypothetical protein
MSKYNVDYKNVTCTDVRWEDGVFIMFYNDVSFCYKPSTFKRLENDEKTIRNIIDMFLIDFSKLCEKSLYNTIDFLNYRMEQINDEMEDCKSSKACASLKVEYDKYREIKTVLTNMCNH